MSSIPFRVTHRRTSTSGRIPALNTLLTGEIYLQLADERVYFKNANEDRLVTLITDASGNGLEKIKFSGASNLDIPYWSGSRFYPTGISSFVQTNQTGSFVISSQITNFVSKSETGNFITSSQTGAFGGNGNVDLSSYVLKTQTGNFITSSQTGAFGGGNINLSSYITTGQTGVFALSADTGNFVTTAQTGVFALSANTGNFVTTAQTGVFALSADTGNFVTAAQTGVFALSANTGNFVTTAQTGVFALSADTGKFASLDNSNYLCQTQIPNITGDVCINAGSNASVVYKIQGYPISNQQPVVGQTLQFDGSTWSPGSIPAGGNGGGGLVYYFNDPVVADLPTGNLPASLSGTFELGRTGTLSQYSVTATSLSQVSYDPIVGFISDVLDPNTTSIPAGLFDFNIWASSNSTAQTILQLKVYKYDGDSTTATLLATSDDVYTYDGVVISQYIMSIVLPQTSLSSTDRLFILLSAKGLGNNKDITLYFGGNTPSHVHTTIPSVGGSGLVKVINGVMQSPASQLVDADVSASAAIAGTKIQAGYFALANATGNFITTSQTGLYAPAAGTGNFITTAQTGCFVNTGSTCLIKTLNSDSLTMPPGGGSYLTSISSQGGILCGSYNAIIAAGTNGFGNYIYTASFSALIGGCANKVLSSCSAIIAGDDNRIDSGTKGVILSSNVSCFCNASCYATLFSSYWSCISCSSFGSLFSSSTTYNKNASYSSAISSNDSLICSGCYSSILDSLTVQMYSGVYSTIIGSTNSELRGFSNSILSSKCSKISSHSVTQSSIIGGSGNCITGSSICNSIILGGTGIIADSGNTVYANNFCAVGGRFLGDGCSLTLRRAVVINAADSVSQYSLAIGGATNTIGGSAIYSTIIGGTSNSVTPSWGTVVGGSNNRQTAGTYGGMFAGGSNCLASNASVILGGSSNCICNSSHCSAILGGEFNMLGNIVGSSTYSTILGGCTNTILVGCSSAIIAGRSNTVINGLTGVVVLGGCSINANSSDTVYAVNYCATGGKFFGDGSALTGLATGSFITTSQTGAFGGVNVDLSNYITNSQTGVFVSTANTGNFITSAQTGAFGSNINTGVFVTTGETGVFALAANTGSFITTAQTGAFGSNINTDNFVTTGQTGVFALAANTGTFVTTGQTGVFALAANTGSFVTTGQTGVFFLAANTGSFLLNTSCGFNLLGTSVVCTGTSGSSVISSCNSSVNSNSSNIIASTGSSIACSRSNIIGSYISSINSINGNIIASNSSSIGTTASDNNIFASSGISISSNSYTNNVFGSYASTIADTNSSYIIASCCSSFSQWTNNNTIFATTKSSMGYFNCFNLVFGGFCNGVGGYNLHGGIYGGSGNLLSNSRTSLIVGGTSNCILVGGSLGGPWACNAVILGGCSNKICSSVALSNSVVIGGCLNLISGCSSVIVGGNRNTLCTGALNSVILGGISITGLDCNTAYSINYCATGGKYYGDGSALTGLATGNFITTAQTGAFGGGNVDLSNYITTGQTGVFALAANTGSFVTTAQTGVFALAANTGNFVTTSQTGAFGGNVDLSSYITTGQTGNFVGKNETGSFIALGKCQVVAKNNTPFDICAVTRVASTYISNQNILNTPNSAWYLCGNDLSVDDCNLYTLANNRYCTAQFSAMIIGNADYGPQYGMLVTSIKVDGIATASGVLSQNKTIHSKAFATDDVCVVVENNYLRIYVTGTQTGMNWGTRLDILGMQGYD